MNRYLLDTNVLSETTKPECDEGVRTFLDYLPDAYISVLSIHEIAYGLECLPNGRRRTNLAQAIEKLLGTFSETILPIAQLGNRQNRLRKCSEKFLNRLR